MDALGRCLGCGGAPAPSDSLLCPIKFPPVGMVFVQRVTPHIGEAFCPVEGDLDKSFIWALFKGATAEFLLQVITHLTVKQAGLEIPTLTLSTWENCTASCVVM